VIALGDHPVEGDQPAGFAMRHPHTLGEWNPNNTLYLGRGQVTGAAHEELRLTLPRGPVSRWRVPEWLREVGLTYHARADRWDGADGLNVAARGQEFIADAGERDDAARWCEDVTSRLRGSAADG
jgi:hypothetical protein